jgi:autotransporter-associated beta strand protein
MKQKPLHLVLLTTALLPSVLFAQRQQQTLGRGVVAAINGQNVTLTWRKLAQDPESATYNLYARQGDGEYTRLNATPLALTNYRTTLSALPVGSDVYVTLLDTLGHESAPSAPFRLRNYDLRNIFVDLDFSRSPLAMADYTTKYVWPVDLDGDGEMDYVVDRLGVSDTTTDKVEAYLRTGEHLWTVDMGPNEFISMGQDDQVVAYDIDCDGRGEVILQTSDGTRFWDTERQTWGDYLLGQADTDGDGIVDYETQSVRNAPRYMTVVDGLTGRERATVEQTYTAYYNRTNRASLMGDEYNKHVGHVGIFYPDGIHPAVVMEYHTRTTDGAHHYFNGAWSYDFSTGQAGAWRQIFNEPTGGATFHQIRIADPDGDGRDEMIEGGYTMDHDGSTLFNTGIAHGDRHRTSDIDPERPGLETFAIQQNASDLLGQILYDAATGQPIKRWYLSEVGDVGRGECMDLDPTHLGYELFSTMDTYMNDAQGNVIEGLATYFPTEGLWWDGELDRERVDSPDGNGYNADIRKYDGGKNTRLFEIAKSSNYKYKSTNAKRALFWGDIIGDWREELILQKWEGGVCTGVTGFTTDLATTVNNIYCLQEDPAYRLQCTTKGYYQSPCTGFYLGYDMPRPQLPPCMVTDLICTASDQYTDYRRADTRTYADSLSLLFDLTTAERITVDRPLAPSALYAMPVSGQEIHLSGSGSLSGTGDLWKSQQGRFVVDLPITTSGHVYVSEGTLEVNADVATTVDLRARGTIAGVGTLRRLTLEGALNYEGGRLAPGRSADVQAVESGASGFAIGTLTLASSLNVDCRTFCEMDLRTASDAPASDLIHVDGDVSLTAPLIFTLVAAEQQPQPGRFKLLEWTGSINDSALTQCSYRGLSGHSCHFEIADRALYLVINAQRAAAADVLWTGAESDAWDYRTENFSLSGTATEFVAGDALRFDDSATQTAVTLSALMPTSGVVIDNTERDYTFSGAGGLSGTGSLTKQGVGTLTLSLTQSDYTGATRLEAGTVVVPTLSDGGQPGPFGAAATDADLWQIGAATLDVRSSNAATDRGLTLTDSATLRIDQGTTSLKGRVTGNGHLTKTGAGQLNFTYAGTNPWTGGLWLRAGTVAMGCWNTTFGASGSPIRVTQGTLKIFDNNTSSAIPALTNPITIDAGGQLTLSAGQRCKLQGAWSGAGDVAVHFPYVRADFSTDLAAFAGTLTVTGSQFRPVAAISCPQGTLELTSGVYMAHYKSGSGTEQNLASQWGALRSSATDCTVATGTYTIGSANTDETFAGTFTASATITKVGSGLWTLTHANAGSLTVAEGAVALNCADDLTCAKTITVRSGATLLGTGQTYGVNLNSGATIAYGKTLDATPIGTLHLTHALNVAAGGTLRIKCRKASYVRSDGFRVDGAITLTSPHFLIEPVKVTFADGDSLCVFSDFGSCTLSGTPTFEPEVPAPGFRWDYSTLTSDGYLRVRATTDALPRIPVDTDGNAPSYDLIGRPQPADARGVTIIVPASRSPKKIIRMK